MRDTKKGGMVDAPSATAYEIKGEDDCGCCVTFLLVVLLELRHLYEDLSIIIERDSERADSSIAQPYILLTHVSLFHSLFQAARRVDISSNHDDMLLVSVVVTVTWAFSFPLFNTNSCFSSCSVSKSSKAGRGISNTVSKVMMLLRGQLIKRPCKTSK